MPLSNRFTKLSGNIIEARRAPRVLTVDETRTVDRFDFKKLLTHVYQRARGAGSILDGAEQELVKEGEREARELGISYSGLMLPRFVVRRDSEQRDMTTTAAQGGHTIAVEKVGILDDFFNASIMRAAGATVLEDLRGTVDVPRLAAGTAPAGKAENATADEPAPTTAMLSLTPKRLPSHIDFSEMLLRQSGPALQALIGKHVVAQMLGVQEAAFFHGSGTNEANGIAGTAGIGSVAGGANGAVPTWANIVALETSVDTQNACLGDLHYATNGQTRAKLKQVLKSGADTASNFILNDLAGNVLNGYLPFYSNAISKTLTKGSSGAVCSAIFFGDFSDYYVGYWGGMSIDMIRGKSNAILGQYTLVCTAYYDGGVARPKSFSAMLDSLSA